MDYPTWSKRQQQEEMEARHAAKIESELAGVGLAPPPESIAALVAHHTAQLQAAYEQIEILKMQIVELQKRTEPESIDRMLAQRLTIGRNPGRY